VLFAKNINNLYIADLHKLHIADPHKKVLLFR